MAQRPSHNATGVEQRLGPRPVGLHLATAAMGWGATTWSAALHLMAAQRIDPRVALLASVEAASDRFRRLQVGIRAYRSHPYRRELPSPPTIWRSPGARLLDYSQTRNSQAPAVLIVPSLINRHYVLDLRAEQSFARTLAVAGIRPFMLVWEEAGRGQRYSTIDDCIAGKLGAALGIVRPIARRPVTILGYCLGGLLAVALAERRSADVAALVLMATPWDFHADASFPPGAAIAALAAFEPMLKAEGALSVDALQFLFYWSAPFRVAEKFVRFAEMDPASPAATAFVALEDWVNDGISLPAPIARTLLAEWYGANSPASGAWSVGGAPVRPTAVRQPALVVVPTRDRIVPPAGALALARMLSNAATLTVPFGHIGMVTGAKAPAKVWQPLIDWLNCIDTKA